MLARGCLASILGCHFRFLLLHAFTSSPSFAAIFFCLLLLHPLVPRFPWPYNISEGPAGPEVHSYGVGVQAKRGGSRGSRGRRPSEDARSPGLDRTRGEKGELAELRMHTSMFVFELHTIHPPITRVVVGTVFFWADAGGGGGFAIRSEHERYFGFSALRLGRSW